LGHEYPVIGGIPRLLIESRSGLAAELTSSTSLAFGKQWLKLGDFATVTVADLILHLPNGWDVTAFKGLALDVGCGMGRYAALVQRYATHVFGIDVSPAVEKASVVCPEGWFAQADIAAAPFAPSSFDVVYSFGVLHHLPDPVQGLQACFRLLKAEGRLLVWVYADNRSAMRWGRRTIRRLVRRVPALAVPAATVAAVALWLGAWWSRRFSLKPLRFYWDKGFRQVYVDCHDALIAPLEVYLTANDCQAWLAAVPAARKGFERRSDGSGWILWALR
jgi:SAM-dependent methyltransferase